MQRSIFLTFLGLTGFCASIAATACGGDDGDKKTTEDVTGAGGADGAGGGGGSPSGGCTTTGPVTDPAACAGTDKPIYDNCKMDCIAQADAEATCKVTSAMTAPGPTDDPTCGAGCTCTKCTQEMIDCGNDPDEYCSVIVKCANEKNCSGVACYAAATCQDVIDAAPGGGLTSISVALATNLSDCVAGVKDPAITCAPACL